MKCEAYVAGIDLPTVTEKATFDRRYEGVAKYPAVNRDLSLVMKKDVFVGSLEKVMKEKGGKLLEKASSYLTFTKVLRLKKDINPLHSALYSVPQNEA